MQLNIASTGTYNALVEKRIGMNVKRATVVSPDDECSL